MRIHQTLPRESIRFSGQRRYDISGFSNHRHAWASFISVGLAMRLLRKWCSQLLMIHVSVRSLMIKSLSRLLSSPSRHELIDVIPHATFPFLPDHRSIPVIPRHPIFLRITLPTSCVLASSARRYGKLLSADDSRLIPCLPGGKTRLALNTPSVVNPNLFAAF